MADDDGRSAGQQSKVSRVLAEYGLDDMGDQLARSWRGEGEPKRSLRELADYCNREIISAAMHDAGVELLEGELDNLYRLLADDEVTTAARTQAETKLSRAGVDVEGLRQDFVSHQAIHTYLTKRRDVEPPAKGASADESIRKRSQTIQRLRNRLVAVSERSLESLRDADHLALESVDVFASVTVHCNECDTTHDIVDVLNQGGCECQLR